ncbi:MAG: DUF1761 domain-containing protein, partial [Candidatus Taylorbacteria bacterium]|nr:DUF1761 domain-containing protein [Candidatus Taylorbacteria bacterium]
MEARISFYDLKINGRIPPYITNTHMIYLTVLTCTILSIVIGSLWYGPIFGKRWMALNNLPDLSDDPVVRKGQMKHMYPAY